MTNKRTVSRRQIFDSFAIFGAAATGALALVALFLTNERSADSVVFSAAGLTAGVVGIAASLVARRVSRSSAETEVVRSILQGLILQVAQGLSVAPSKVSADVYTLERPLIGKPRTVRQFHERIASFEDVSYSKHGDVAERVAQENAVIWAPVDGGTEDRPVARASALGVPITKWTDGPVSGALIISVPRGAFASLVDDGGALRNMKETSTFLSLLLG